MAVVGHVRGYEHPLWEVVVLEVLVEEGEVFGEREARRRVVDVVHDGRVVLAHVVVCVGLLVLPFCALETAGRHVFLVGGPGYALCVEEVGDAVYALWH